MKDLRKCHLLTIWLKKVHMMAMGAQRHGNRLEAMILATCAKEGDGESCDRLLERVKGHYAAWKSIEICIQDALEKLEAKAPLSEVCLRLEETLRRSRVAATNTMLMEKHFHVIGSRVEVRVLQSFSRYMVSVLLEIHGVQLPLEL